MESTIESTSNSVDSTTEPTINSVESNIESTINSAESNKDATINSAESNKDATINSAESNIEPTSNSAESNIEPIINSAESNIEPTINSAESNIEPIIDSVESNIEPTINSAESNKDSVLKEFQQLMPRIPEAFHGQVEITRYNYTYDEHRLFFWMRLTPNDGLFKNHGVDFLVRVTYENYPYSSPYVTCYSHVFHPNMSYAGWVSHVDDEWEPTMGLEDCVAMVLSLLHHPQMEWATFDECSGITLEEYTEYLTAMGSPVGLKYHIPPLEWLRKRRGEGEEDDEEEEEEEESKRSVTPVEGKEEGKEDNPFTRRRKRISRRQSF